MFHHQRGPITQLTFANFSSSLLLGCIMEFSIFPMGRATPRVIFQTLWPWILATNSLPVMTSKYLALRMESEGSWAWIKLIANKNLQKHSSITPIIPWTSCATSTRSCFGNASFRSTTGCVINFFEIHPQTNQLAHTHTCTHLAQRWSLCQPPDSRWDHSRMSTREKMPWP